jgi:hypothetical protein
MKKGFKDSRVQVNVGEGLVPSRVFLTSGDHEGRPYVDSEYDEKIQSLSRN